MRIVHVISYIQPEFGYEEFFVPRELAAMGHDVHVISSDRIFPFNDVEKMLKDVGSKYRGRKRPVGVEEIEGFKIHRKKVILEMLYDYVVFPGVAEELRRLRPDVVHAHGVWPWCTFQVAKMKKELGFRFILDEHAYGTTYDQRKTLRNRLLDLQYRIIRAPLARYSIRRADELVSICAETEVFLKEFYGASSHMIPLGIDQRLFSFKKAARDKVRRSLGISDREFLLVTAGRLDDAKKLELFVEAVKGMGQDVTLVLIGRGDKDYLARLKKLAKGSRASIRFMGFKRPDELSEIYCAGDLGLWGKASITIREAIGCQLPLVLLDVPNMRDLVIWDNGVLVKQEPKAIRRTIQELLDDPDRRARMGKAGRKGVEESLSVQAEAKRLLELYTGGKKKRRSK